MTTAPTEYLLGEKLAAYSVFASITFFTLGIWIFMGFVPPLAPNLPAAETANYYREHSVMIRLGCSFAMIGASCMGPLFGAMFAVVRRMKRRSTALAAIQLIMGATVVTLFIAVFFFWGAASFRLDRSDEAIVLLSDVGWIMLTMAAPGLSFAMLAIGLGILNDDRNSPLIPRWVGWYNVWYAVMSFPAIFTILVTSGPLAWNGIIPFWIPLIAFGGWCVIMAISLLKHARQQEVGA